MTNTLTPLGNELQECLHDVLERHGIQRVELATVGTDCRQLFIGCVGDEFTPEDVSFARHVFITALISAREARADSAAPEVDPGVAEHA